MTSKWTENVEFQRNRIEEIHDYGIDTDSHMLYMHGEDIHFYNEEESREPGVEFRMANRVIKNLDVLTGIDAETPITISMKTCGGDWIEGMAIYDAIIAVPNPVSIISYTHARSMSSIILQAANKRILMPHSSFMFHMGTLATSGTHKQVITDIDWNRRIEKQMTNIYIDRMKTTPNSKVTRWGKQRIEDWLVEQMDKKEEVYFTAEEAISWGFADEIFTDWGAVTSYTKDQRSLK